MASFTAKFDEYRDADSPIIYDVDEELAIMREMNEKGVEPKDALSKVELLSQKLKGFNLERKKSATACFLAIYLDLEKKPSCRWRQRSFRHRRVGGRPPPRELLRHHHLDGSEAH